MLNPFNPEQNPDPSGNLAGMRLQKRLLQEVQAARIDDRIFQTVQDAFEEALKKEQLVAAGYCKAIPAGTDLEAGADGYGGEIE